jgi:phage gp16-like protein
MDSTPMSRSNHWASNAQRVSRVRLIQILARETGLRDDGDDAAYRLMIQSVTGRESCTSTKDCSLDELSKIIDHLKRGRPKTYPGRPHNTDVAGRAELKKIEALLTDAGLPWAYANSIAQRQCRKARVAFCSSLELVGIVAALERAALKRLKAALDAELKARKQDWDNARTIARTHFGLGERADLQKSTQGMSLVLRFLRGELPQPPAAHAGQS